MEEEIDRKFRGALEEGDWGIELDKYGKEIIHEKVKIDRSVIYFHGFIDFKCFRERDRYHSIDLLNLRVYRYILYD